MAKQQPVARFRAGGVSCALWENDVQMNGESKTLLKATVARRYKDKSGEWKSTGSFGRNEIPLAIWCLEKAFDAIIGEQGNGGDKQPDVPVEDVAD